VEKTMENNIADVFLRNKIAEVLKEINEMNNAKVERDIKFILDGGDVNKLLHPKFSDEIAKLETIKFELNLLFSCLSIGIETTYEELLEAIGDESEEFRQEMIDFFEALKANTTKEVVSEGEAN
jgi:hypothetical protein